MDLDSGGRQHHPGVGVVVEALGKGEVLDARGVTHAASHRAGVGGEPCAPREVARVIDEAFVGEGNRLEQFQHLEGRQGSLDDLARGGHPVAPGEGVALADLHRVDPDGLGETIHLGLGREVDLDHTEAAHRPGRRVVGPCSECVDEDVVAAVRADGEIRRVRQHRARGLGIAAAVQDHSGFDFDELPMVVGFVAKGHTRGMAVDVTDERLAPVVFHLDRPSRAERQHADVDLERDVLAGAERAAHARRVASHLVRLHAEAWVDLLVIDVDPLARGPQIDAALTVRNRQAGLGAEGCLVLGPHLVRALDDEFAARFPVSAADVHLFEDRTSSNGFFRIGEGPEGLVFDHDRAHSPARRLPVVRRNERDRLTPIADGAVAQHRLVLMLLAEVGPAWYVFLGEHGAYPCHRQCRCYIQPGDPGVAVRASQGRRPQHPVRVQVRCVGEVAYHLRYAVRSDDRLSHPAGNTGAGDGVALHGVLLTCRHEHLAANPSRPRRMAP